MAAVETPHAPHRAFDELPDGSLEEAPTACWELHLNEPFRHVLFCNHEITLSTVRPCRSNCKTSSTADSKAHGKWIPCGQCFRLKKARASSPLVPTPRRASNHNRVATVKRREVEQPNQLFVGGASDFRSPKKLKMNDSRAVSSTDEDEVRKRLNEEIAQDPALQQLVATASGPGIRQRSTIHSGFALREELLTKQAAANLSKEVRNLQVDSTDALRFGRAVRRRAVDEPGFSAPDREFGEKPKRGHPLKRAWNAHQPPPEAFVEKGIADVHETEGRKSVKRRKGKQSLHDQAKLEQKIENDPAEALVETARGTGVRRPTHLGSHRVFDQDRMQIDADPNMPRELRNLQVDGTEVLHYGLPRPEKSKWIYQPILPSRTPEVNHDLDEVQSEDRPVAEGFSGALLTHSNAVNDTEDAELFCVCQSVADDSLVLCTRCELWFHPACLEKEHPLYGANSIKGELSEPFLCTDCEEEFVKLKAAKKESSAPKIIHDMRAETIQKRLEVKKLEAEVERGRMEELFSEGSEDFEPHHEEMIADPATVPEAASGEKQEISDLDVEMADD